MSWHCIYLLVHFSIIQSKLENLTKTKRIIFNMKQMWCIFDKLLIKCQNIYNHCNRIAVRQSHTIRRQSASIVWPVYKCMVRTLKNQRYYLMKLLIRLAVARHAFIWWVFFFTGIGFAGVEVKLVFFVRRVRPTKDGQRWEPMQGKRVEFLSADMEAGMAQGRSVGRPDSRVGAWVTTHYCSPFFPSAKSSPATCIIPALMFYGFLLIRSKKMHCTTFVAWV